MKAPDKIKRLVEVFERNLEAYKSSGYKEANVRSEFIDPFFEALGWDVHNRQGYAEAYKDVITEDAIKVGGATKAPDYCFRVGGARKFFVEAKKPSVDIKGDVSPAYQLRRYAWSAGLPLSILTDFEEFAVYDCRTRPRLQDKSGHGRVIYLTFHDYPEKWEEIAAVFSKQAVLEGRFDKYVESKGKRATQVVDVEFLKEIEEWRSLLARNIALRNPALGIRELNFAVQRTIDRIIFLRICEDRGIEFYGRLQALTNGPGVYGRLKEIFLRADEKYNSGLFHFHREKGSATPPDELTLNLKIDDRVLKEIFKRLYYPESPYEFSVLGAEILGHIYEQFLGKVIKLTAGHQAKVEEKPEVRKAGGVYYTPTYIVDYIVQNTIGKLCEGKTPKRIERLRILDPACGSGSFLIGAYSFLIGYHRDWYLERLAPQGKAGHISKAVLRRHVPGANPEVPIYQGKGGQWYLTTREKKRILLNNIYGVDIDSQAVEVTKLSLLLKVLENENQDSLERQMKLWRERALPDLGNNIKCGNSLIGPDFYENRQLTLLEDEEQTRVNAFDWTAEFPGIMQSGGFDAVIGNPPYIRIQAMKEWAPVEVEFYKRRYISASKGNYDIYVVFVEKGLSLLNKNGRLGFILPHKFFNSKYGEPLRGLIAGGKNLAHVVHFGDQQVFDGATTYTALMFLDKDGNDSFELVRVNDLGKWRLGESQPSGKLKAKSATPTEWSFVIGAGAGFFARLTEMPVKLSDVTNRIFQGPITSADMIFLFKNFKQEKQGIMKVESPELGESVLIESAILKRVVRSGSIGRYYATPMALVLFPYEVKETEARLFTPKEMQNNFPLAWKYLNINRDKLENREKGKFKDTQWYRFGRTQNLGIWEQPKLMIPYMIADLSAYLDRKENFYFINVTTGGYGITSDEKSGSLEYLCALLNSRLLDFYLKHVATNFHGGYFAANKQYIEQLPIRTIDFSDPIDKIRHDKIVTLVEQILKLNKHLAKVKAPNEKTRLERQIKATDNQIDQLIYELYGLTEEEIKVVKGVIV